jgi:adenosylmethionine-8-amino-7-oxononanoate aminotransferase
MEKSEIKKLRKEAKDHLWLHFTDAASYNTKNPLPIIERGEGCYLFDVEGKKYLDGLSSLFCVNAGHGRDEIARAIKNQADDLEFMPLWSYAHPGAIRLASRIAHLAPGDLDHVFFTSGGAESVESALKLARAYHKRRGNGEKTKFISRRLAYHGTTLGALAATGLPFARTPYEPLTPGGVHALETNTYRNKDHESFLESIHDKILFEGPETIAAIILEPVQNAGGCLVAPDGYFQGVRALCDRYDILLISDEVICSWGRLGAYFGCQRIGYQPDIITTAKGITSAYQPLGAMIASERIADYFKGDPFVHGFTFAGHPLACAAAHANLDIFEREDLNAHVLENEDLFRHCLENLRDIPVVGDVRGMGYFQAIEIVKDQETKETFNERECDLLLRDILSPFLYKEGLICRADDRGDPVIQLAPPLIAGEKEFHKIEKILRKALLHLSDKLHLFH